MNGGLDQKINFAAGPEVSRISDKVLFDWTAPSFQKGERSIRWYLAIGFIVVAVIGYSAWQKDWFVIGITIIVAAILMWYLRAATPHDTRYKLTPMGIYIDDRFSPFSEMHSFWMVYNDKVKNLYMVYRRKYLPALIINIDKVDPLILKGYLLKKLPEQEDRGENLLDRLVRLLGI